ncbi:MFS general substrate transporter [Suillus decipiens]|nr:MFS general substrate transporter [Suillus decipiens]
MTAQDDEEAPLLQQPGQPTTRTPLPWNQFWIILFAQLSDPLTSLTLTPFIPELIRDIGVTHGDETQVGYYVGILQSSYYAAHALTVFHWGRLSDHIGRKPVILIALLTMFASTVSFELSKTFLGLLARCRAVRGAFNSSNIVIESMVMDITDATNMPRAYGYMPIPWLIGGITTYWGSFSRPADRFPDIFGGSELLKTYPYLFPCSISAIFVAATWLVTYSCLKESVSTRTALWELIKGGLSRQSYAKSRQPSNDVLVNPGEPVMPPWAYSALRLLRSYQSSMRHQSNLVVSLLILLALAIYSRYKVPHMSYFSCLSTLVYMITSVQELSISLALVPAYPSLFYFQ